MANRIHAIYPGTFDPPTNGHLDIVRRGLRLFSRVTVAVSVHPSKAPVFSFEERRAFFLEEFRDAPGVGVVSFEQELLVGFARRIGAQAIIRGLRAVSDFDYEFQMTLMNRRLDDGVETIFLMPSEQYSFISSSLVKEVASLGGDISRLAPPSVCKALAGRLKA